MSLYIPSLVNLYISSYIGATTVSTGENGHPTFRLVTDNVLVPQIFLLQFKKKQEISQQVLFHNLHLIVFLVVTTMVATMAEK